jgi:lipoyl(octanoyl) transferase
MTSWFLLAEPEPFSAAENMARDESLFRLCHLRPMGVLRVYGWEKPSFSYGASQRVDRAVDVSYVREHGGEYVRRITGGKTVLHNDEVTYAVASSEEIFYSGNDLYQSYLLISRVLVKALQSLGLDALLSKGSSSELARSDNPCFSFPTANEIEVNGRKIVGSAQKRDRQALLQHGSIPLTMDYDLYAHGARFDARLLRNSMVALQEVSRVTGTSLRLALETAFADFVGAPLVPFEMGELQDGGLDELRRKYGSPEWNHLR